jgi:ABC-type microcin C transport system permease subunit YejE
MQFFIDTANLDQIKEAQALGIKAAKILSAQE